DLVLVRARPLGPVARGRLAAVARPEGDDLVPDGDRVTADVDDHLVHRHLPDERCSPAADPDLGTAGRGSWDAVGVPERYQRQMRVPGRALHVVVPDAPAGLDMTDLDHAGPKRHRRSETIADAEEARADPDEVMPGQH